MNKFKLLLFLTFVLNVSFISIAESSKKKVITRSNKITEVVTNERGDYYPISISTLINMAWKYGVYKKDDYKALSDLIHAVDCEIYIQYIHDDFAWNRIVESKKREIGYYGSNVPDRFVLSDVIQLSKYDFNEKLFYLRSNYTMNNAGIFTLYDSVTFKLPPCPVKRPKSIKSFVEGYRIKLLNPLSLNAFPITPEDAEKLIRNFQETGNFNREMYSRIFVRVNGLDSTKLGFGSRSHITYQGQVERVEIYSDIETTNLVYEKNFR
jgi:hypothetical protein